MPKPTRTPRRKPQQARARATRDAIFEAAAQILEREGERAFNTNRIAERAGVSIGTLYQYFPDKTAILVAMARREMAALAHDQQGIASRPQSRAQILRLSIRRLIRAFEGRPATRRAAVKAVIAAESAEALGREVDRTAYILPGIEGATRLDAFVLTRAVIGVVRAAVLENNRALHSPAFEAALLRLIERYERR